MCLRAHIACATVYATAAHTGAWTTESGPSNVRRAGDEIVLTTLTINNGTATLESVTVTDTISGDATCTPKQPVPELNVGESFTCRASHKVRAV